VTIHLRQNLSKELEQSLSLVARKKENVGEPWVEFKNLSPKHMFLH